MLAAISAARLGAHVTILEKNQRVGKKILATGNGRCNFTNVNAGYSCYSSENPGFVQKALSDFTASTLSAFEELGFSIKLKKWARYSLCPIRPPAFLMFYLLTNCLGSI